MPDTPLDVLRRSTAIKIATVGRTEETLAECAAPVFVVDDPQMEMEVA